MTPVHRTSKPADQWNTKGHQARGINAPPMPHCARCTDHAAPCALHRTHGTTPMTPCITHVLIAHHMLRPAHCTIPWCTICPTPLTRHRTHDAKHSAPRILKQAHCTMHHAPCALQHTYGNRQTYRRTGAKRVPVLKAQKGVCAIGCG